MTLSIIAAEPGKLKGFSSCRALLSSRKLDLWHPHQRGRTWLLQPVQSWSMTAFPVRGNASESSTETADLGEMETEEKVEPYELVKDDILALSDNIKKELSTDFCELRDISHYHFDGQGKAFRPMVVLLMARACNLHYRPTHSEVLSSQKTVAMISEMIHTASLVHDDVVDSAETRRGKVSVQSSWGQKNAIVAGDYIMSVSSIMLARVGNNQVMEAFSQILEDLVAGEFMQLGSKEDESERFNHYMTKTFKKTASLLANSCKSVAILGECSGEIVECAYQYGRNVGIAFQLVDDLLDFTSNEALMGKPTAADLKLGLATAPVLFAAVEHPELNSMIMRRFREPGDVNTAWNLVAKSNGVAQTKMLARQHCQEALRHLMQLRPSQERSALVTVMHKVLNRLK
ncbi:Decaprenyl-diphosphate synthase subunit 1 [Lamellibrachia satsuma]|nr:Decaprenyl-diphosphate synthase subunit 1 [Lamellibrachia satsuma]